MRALLVCVLLAVAIPAAAWTHSNVERTDGVADADATASALLVNVFKCERSCSLAGVIFTTTQAQSKYSVNRCTDPLCDTVLLDFDFAWAVANPCGCPAPVGWFVYLEKTVNGRGGPFKALYAAPAGDGRYDIYDWASQERTGYLTYGRGLWSVYGTGQFRRRLGYVRSAKSHAPVPAGAAAAALGVLGPFCC